MEVDRVGAWGGCVGWMRGVDVWRGYMYEGMSRRK